MEKLTKNHVLIIDSDSIHVKYERHRTTYYHALTNTNEHIPIGYEYEHISNGYEYEHISNGITVIKFLQIFGIDPVVYLEPRFDMMFLIFCLLDLRSQNYPRFILEQNYALLDVVHWIL